MVGVPGRSRGCRTCRQRRIKCDTAKPECKNCLRTGRVCLGYQRAHAFILSKHMDLVDDSGLEAELPSGSSSATNPLAVSFRKAQTPETEARARSARPRSASRLTCPDSPCTDDRGASPLAIAHLPTAPSLRHAVRDQLIGGYIQHRPKGGRQLHTRPRDLMVEIAGCPDISPVLEAALLTFCMARFGRMTEQPHLVSQSLPLYTECLGELRTALARPSTRLHDHTLAACMLLSLYEFYECPGNAVEAYRAHVDGAMHLMRLRGPTAHTEGLAQSLFVAIRLHVVFQDLQLCRTSFLATPSWIAEPFMGTTKDPYDELIDFFLHFPALVELCERVDRHLPPAVSALSGTSRSSDPSTAAFTSVHLALTSILTALKAAWQLDYALATWLAKLEASIPGPLYQCKPSEAPPSDADTPESGRLFPVVFDFPSFAVGQSFLLYWTGQMMLQSYLRGLFFDAAALSEALSERRDEMDCSCPAAEDAAVPAYELLPNVPSQKGEGGGVVESDEHRAVARAAVLAAGTISACPRHFSAGQLPSLDDALSSKQALRKTCQSVEFFLQRKAGAWETSVLVPSLATAKAVLPFLDGNVYRERLWVGEMLGKVHKKGNSLAAYL